MLSIFDPGNSRSIAPQPFCSVRGLTSREKVKMEIVSNGTAKDVSLPFIAVPFEYMGNTYAFLQLESINDIIGIQGLVPICSACKRIRTDGDFWRKIGNYFSNKLDLEFTHGICPDCAKSLYPELNVSTGAEDKEKLSPKNG